MIKAKEKTTPDIHANSCQKTLLTLIFPKAKVTMFANMITAVVHLTRSWHPHIGKLNLKLNFFID